MSRFADAPCVLMTARGFDAAARSILGEQGFTAALVALDRVVAPTEPRPPAGDYPARTASRPKSSPPSSVGDRPHQAALSRTANAIRRS